MDHKSSRRNFSGNIGFVLAAAGAAVGLGNVWGFLIKFILPIAITYIFVIGIF